MYPFRLLMLLSSVLIHPNSCHMVQGSIFCHLNCLEVFAPFPVYLWQEITISLPHTHNSIFCYPLPAWSAGVSPQLVLQFPSIK